MKKMFKELLSRLVAVPAIILVVFSIARACTTGFTKQDFIDLLTGDKKIMWSIVVLVIVYILHSIKVSGGFNRIIFSINRFKSRIRRKFTGSIASKKEEENDKVEEKVQILYKTKAKLNDKNKRTRVLVDIIIKKDGTLKLKTRLSNKVNLTFHLDNVWIVRNNNIITINFGYLQKETLVFVSQTKASEFLLATKSYKSGIIEKRREVSNR